MPDFSVYFLLFISPIPWVPNPDAVRTLPRPYYGDAGMAIGSSLLLSCTHPTSVGESVMCQSLCWATGLEQ